MAGAAGDALGFTVEFWSKQQIHSRYGEQGITQFELAPDGKAWGSDDTQMTLFTANALRHIDSMRDAIIAAVNHNGDSDSTGAICGNIMGAIVGLEGIPIRFIEHLELKDLIIDIADDLIAGCTINEYHSPATPEEERAICKYTAASPSAWSASPSASSASPTSRNAPCSLATSTA